MTINIINKLKCKINNEKIIENILEKKLIIFFTLLIYISAYDPLHANNKNISIWFNNKTDQSLIKTIMRQRH